MIKTMWKIFKKKEDKIYTWLKLLKEKGYIKKETIVIKLYNPFTHEYDFKFINDKNYVEEDKIRMEDV